MKKFRTLLIALICALCLVFSLAFTAGCKDKDKDKGNGGTEQQQPDGNGGNQGNTEHQHTWSDWKKSDSKHWKETTCTGHTAEKKDEADHVYDNDQDTTCNVCGYVRTVTAPSNDPDGTKAHPYLFDKEDGNYEINVPAGGSVYYLAYLKSDSTVSIVSESTNVKLSVDVEESTDLILLGQSGDTGFAYEHDHDAGNYLLVFSSKDGAAAKYNVKVTLTPIVPEGSFSNPKEINLGTHSLENVEADGEYCYKYVVTVEDYKLYFAWGANTKIVVEYVSGEASVQKSSSDPDDAEALELGLEIAEGTEVKITVINVGTEKGAVSFTISNTEITDGTIAKPHYLLEGENVIAVPAGGKVYYTFAIKVNAFVSLSSTSGNVRLHLYEDFSSESENYIDSENGAFYIDGDMDAGEVYYFAFATIDGAAETYTVNVRVTVPGNDAIVIDELGEQKGKVPDNGYGWPEDITYEYTVKAADAKLYFAAGTDTLIIVSYEGREGELWSSVDSDAAILLAGLELSEGTVVTIVVTYSGDLENSHSPWDVSFTIDNKPIENGGSESECDLVVGKAETIKIPTDNDSNQMVEKTIYLPVGTYTLTIAGENIDDIIVNYVDFDYDSMEWITGINGLVIEPGQTSCVFEVTEAGVYTLVIQDSAYHGGQTLTILVEEGGEIEGPEYDESIAVDGDAFILAGKVDHPAELTVTGLVAGNKYIVSASGDFMALMNTTIYLQYGDNQAVELEQRMMSRVAEFTAVENVNTLKIYIVNPYIDSVELNIYLELNDEGGEDDNHPALNVGSNDVIIPEEGEVIYEFAGASGTYIIALGEGAEGVTVEYTYGESVEIGTNVYLDKGIQLVFKGNAGTITVTVTKVGDHPDGSNHNWGEWKPDEENHNQHIRDCEDCEEIDSEAHVDEKNNDTEANEPDGKCDVCGYEMSAVEPPHEHTYTGTDYLYDEHDGENGATGHYRECDAHDGVYEDKVPHVFDNDSDTNCDLCGYEREVDEEGEVVSINMSYFDLKDGDSAITPEAGSALKDTEGNDTGITVYGGTVDYNSKSIIFAGNSVSVTNRFKFGGTFSSTDASKGGLKVELDKDATILVYEYSGSSGNPLSIALYDESKSKLADTEQSIGDGSAIGVAVFEVKADTVYYIGSANSGINIYYIAIFDKFVDTTKESHEAVAATCETAGNHAYTITNYGRYILTETQKAVAPNEVKIAALGHAYATEAVELTEQDTVPTESATGLYKATCTRSCGHVENIILPVLKDKKYSRTADGASNGNYKYTYKDENTGCTVVFEAKAVQADNDSFDSWLLDFAGNKVSATDSTGETKVEAGSTGVLAVGDIVGGAFSITDVGNKTQISSGFFSISGKNSKTAIITLKVEAPATFALLYNNTNSDRTFTIKNSSGGTAGTGYMRKDQTQTFELAKDTYTIEFEADEHKITMMSLTYTK